LTGPAVRAVVDADGPALIQLIDACWAEYPGCLLDVDREEPWLRAPATAYARGGGWFWVVDGGPPGPALMGCVGLRPHGDGGAAGGELKSLYVARPARRRGLGAALVGVVEARARQAGLHRLELWSDTRFADAHRLYTRLGYRRRPETRRLFDLSDTTEYHFAKEL